MDGVFPAGEQGEDPSVTCPTSANDGMYLTGNSLLGQAREWLGSSKIVQQALSPSPLIISFLSCSFLPPSPQLSFIAQFSYSWLSP